MSFFDRNKMGKVMSACRTTSTSLQTLVTVDFINVAVNLSRSLALPPS